MATLNSPGVEVTVIDESFYTPAAPGTVPLLVVTSAENKQNASGTGTAQGTLKANAGKVYIITSQRDLTDTFGTPSFPTDASGNSMHAGEMNEYGLQAAYSLLGVSSRAYVVRADVDLAELAATASAPAGEPVGGTYWVDTSRTLYGINEWSSAGSGGFTVKTPLIIDQDNYDTVSSGGVPNDSFGTAGSYAVYITSENEITLWYKTSDAVNAWKEVKQGFNGGKELQISPHYTYPNWTTATTITGSVWLKTTTPGLGANFNIKVYNSATKTWDTVTANLYDSTVDAFYNLDRAGGGVNIPVGRLFIETNYEHGAGTNKTGNWKIWRRAATGSTSVVLDASTATFGGTASFTVRETLQNTSTWSATRTVTINSTSTTALAAQIPAAVSAAGLTNVSATYVSATRKLTFTHALGGDIEIGDPNGTLSTATNSSAGFFGLTPYNPITQTGTPFLNAAPTYDTGFNYLVSNWRPLTFVPQTTAPTTTPADGQMWFNNVNDADILVHNGTTWVGYRNYDFGFGAGLTDPNGPIVSATEPTKQSTGANLAEGDIWIDTSDMDNYGKNVYVYNFNTKVWVKQDVTDQSTPNGWLFADARWATAGSLEDPSSIRDLLSSNYLDPDAPDPSIYPRGMRLWNTRRSGNNVKKYFRNYINVTANNGKNIRFNTEDMANYFTNRWVSYESRNEDGSGRFGRHAQRGVVVAALKSVLDTNQAIRDTDTLDFNLIATPGYPEAIANMIGLNTDRGQTAFVVGDTPFRLEPNGTTLTAWGKNSNLAFDNGEDGLVTADEYLGVFYPSGFTTDNTGNNIVVPPSHMILRTITNSDAKSYQWYAPAGTRRGGVDNATSVGYVDGEGEFRTVALHQGLRDVLQAPGVNINPIATFPGIGLVNFGQKTRAKNASALDRINVVRLVAYLRKQLTVMAKPYLFEPNDAQTRKEIKSAADSLLLELVGLRAIYDFITVCDNSNNTPARIDRNELWLDIAIEPVKAVEFIYIPLRIKNTGEIAAGA